MQNKDAIIIQLLEEVKMLRVENSMLKEKIARLEKNSSNSSKPPSSDIVKPIKILRRFGKKRKHGGQPGHNKFSRQLFEPKDVDEVIEYELKGKDAVGLKPLDEWSVVQQISLPEKMHRVIEHRARKYIDIVTGKIYTASIPDEIRKGGLFGTDINAAVAFMKGKCHMSYTVIQSFFKEIMKLDISRGCEVLEKILGKDFYCVICSDYWGAYRKYARLFNVRMQYCMTHLIRDIRFLAEHSVKKLSRWGHYLLEWLEKLFKTLHCPDKLTDRGFVRLLKQIKDGFLSRVRRPPDHAPAKKLARRFKGEAAENYFRFLTEPGIEPTNNGTERQIRPVVIDRRITQGTRGDVGMRWCERIWTILATCKKQNRNVFDFIKKSLLAHWTNTCYPMLLRTVMFFFILFSSFSYV